MPMVRRQTHTHPRTKPRLRNLPILRETDQTMKTLKQIICENPHTYAYQNTIQRMVKEWLQQYRKLEGQKFVKTPLMKAIEELEQ